MVCLRRNSSTKGFSKEQSMVKVCRLNAYAAKYLSHNERSGWPDGVAYSPSSARKKRRSREKVLSVVRTLETLPNAIVERLDTIGESLL